MSCEFYDERRDMCVAKEIVKIYGARGHGLRIGRLRKGHKKRICSTYRYFMCTRRIKLHSIIKYGDYEG